MFEDNAVRTGDTVHFLPKMKIKCYNVMIDGKKFFVKPVKNNLITYDNIQKLQLVKEMITKLVVY